MAGLTPPVGIGSDEESSKVYLDALNRQLQALENRGGINWAQVSAALANPGRTGTFGEAFGNAMGVIGKQQEEEQAREPQIAQMRAALAGQQYQVKQDVKENQLFNAIAEKHLQGQGTQSTQGTQAGQGSLGGVGGYNPALVSDLTNVLPVMRADSPNFKKVEAILKNQLALGDLAIKEGGLNTQQANSYNDAMVQAYRYGIVPQLPRGYGAQPTTQGRESSAILPYPVQGATITSGYGERNNPVEGGKQDHYGVDFGAPLGSKVQSIVPGIVEETGTSPTFGNFVKVKTPDGFTVQYSHLQGFGDEIKPGSRVDTGTQIGQVGSTGTSTGPHLDVRAFDAKGNPFNIQPYFSQPQQKQPLQATSNLPPEKQAEIEAARLKGEQESATAVLKEQQLKRLKPFEDKYNTLAQFDDQFVNSNNQKYDELIDLVKNNKYVVGQLFKQNLFTALAVGAEEGVRLPNGSISLPVTEILKRLTLTPEQQGVARNIAQLVADLNQNVMKNGKAIYGPQISEYDARQMAKPGFSDTDPASFIMYLAAKQKLANMYMGKIAEAQQQYFEDNHGATTSSFFNTKNTKSPYKELSDEFHSLNKQLIEKSPYTNR